jgi:hypothetical protein
MLEFITLVKGLKFKKENLFCTYFYFWNKDHHLAYCSMFMHYVKHKTNKKYFKALSFTRITILQLHT